MTPKRIEPNPEAAPSDEAEAPQTAVQAEIEATWTRASALAERQRAQAALEQAQTEAAAQKQEVAAQAQRSIEAAWERASTSAERQRAEQAAMLRQQQAQDLDARWDRATAAQAQRADAEKARLAARAAEAAAAAKAQEKAEAQAKAQRDMDAAFARASSIAAEQRAPGPRVKPTSSSAETEARKQAFAARFRQEEEERAQKAAAYELLMATAGIRNCNTRTLLGSSPWGGRFDVVSVLSKSAQGSTFAVVDRSTGASCAARVLDLQGARDWNALGLAERESEALKRVRHPLLPEYVTTMVDQNTGDQIVVTKRIDGTTLTAASAHFPVMQRTAAALPLVCDLLDALAALHNAAPPLVHRDVKPDHVIVSRCAALRDAKFYLIDLGGVGLLHHDGSEPVGIGTIEFMAPEQLHGNYSPASDLFSLAMTAIAFVSNQEPIAGRAVDVDVIVGSLGKGLRRFLAQLLRPDPATRPASVEAARLELAKAVRGDGVDFDQFKRERERRR